MGGEEVIEYTIVTMKLHQNTGWGKHVTIRDLESSSSSGHKWCQINKSVNISVKSQRLNLPGKQWDMFVELCGKFTPNNTLEALKPKGVIQTYKSYCNSNFKKMIRKKKSHTRGFQSSLQFAEAKIGIRGHHGPRGRHTDFESVAKGVPKIRWWSSFWKMIEK